MAKSRCPLITTPLPHVLLCTSLVFFVIACAVPDWSSGTVSSETDQAFGSFTIGLWTACADLTQSVGNSQPVSLFSPLSECRLGHCTQSDDLAQNSNWNAENLCDKSAAVQTFAILSVVIAAMGLFFTSWRALAGRTVLWGKGAIMSALATLFSLISWATWVDWSRMMNSNKPTIAARWMFSDLDTGAGVILTILGMLCSLINVFLMRSRYINQCKAVADLKKRRHESQSGYAGANGAESTTKVENENYLEVSDQAESGNHVPNIPLPRRPGSVSYKLDPADNKQTAL